MVIREAGIKDFEKVFELRMLLKKEERKLNKDLLPLKDSMKYYREYLRNDLNSSWRGVFVAEEKGEMVGLVLGKIYRSLRIAGYERRGYISNVYVKSSHRRKGIAKKLVKEMIKWLKSKGAKEVTLELYLNNKPAIELYKTFGFKDYTIKMLKKRI